jgi:hypothetical protein
MKNSKIGKGTILTIAFTVSLIVITLSSLGSRNKIHDDITYAATENNIKLESFASPVNFTLTNFASTMRNGLELAHEPEGLNYLRAEYATEMAAFEEYEDTELGMSSYHNDSLTTQGHQIDGHPLVSIQYDDHFINRGVNAEAELLAILEMNSHMVEGYKVNDEITYSYFMTINGMVSTYPNFTIDD